MPRMDVVTANSIAHVAMSLEAVALRVRKSIGDPNAYRVLEWACAEIESISTDAKAIADESRVDDATEASR